MASHPGEFGPDDFVDEDDDFKELFGLPDTLPPIRLPPLPELAARARQAPMTRQLGALAEWVGEDGRTVPEEGWLPEPVLPEPVLLEALSALGITSDDFEYLWDYAIAVDWLAYDDDLVIPSDTAEAWSQGDDESVLDAWTSTLAAVLSDTFFVRCPEDPDDWAKLYSGLAFEGQGIALAVLLFIARGEGVSRTDFTEVLWEDATGDMTADEATGARARWLATYGDPARLLLDKLLDLDAVTEDDEIIRLTPLSLAALHEQLVESDVDIPLLPATAAEMTGAQLLAMAEGVDDEEFEAEADAWVAAHGADDGARELLHLAAAGRPGERMIAVAAVTRIGAAAEPAWRDSLDVPELRGYAKIALAGLAGLPDPEDLPSDLEPLPEDIAWLTTDLLSLACDDEFPDPEELEASFREVVPTGREAAFFDTMWRSSHPGVVDVLNHVGRHHPDKKIAKAARTAAYKATSHRATRRQA